MNLFLLKLALPGIMPPPSAMSKAIGGASHLIPKPGKLPGVISSGFKPTAGVLHQDASSAGAFVGKGFGAAQQAASTIAPGKFIKAACAAFFDELEGMIAAGVADASLREKFASADVEAMLAEVFWKSAGVPPPLPLAARTPKLYGGPAADAIFSGMKGVPKGVGSLASAAKPAASAMMGKLVKGASGAMEVAGLGMLAAPSIDNIQAKLRTSKGGDVDKKRLIKNKYHDAMEVGGLGVLASPYLRNKIRTGNFDGISQAAKAVL